MGRQPVPLLAYRQPDAGGAFHPSLAWLFMATSFAGAGASFLPWGGRAPILFLTGPSAFTDALYGAVLCSPILIALWRTRLRWIAPVRPRSAEMVLVTLIGAALFIAAAIICASVLAESQGGAVVRLAMVVCAALLVLGLTLVALCYYWDLPDAECTTLIITAPYLALCAPFVWLLFDEGESLRDCTGALLGAVSACGALAEIVLVAIQLVRRMTTRAHQR
jgi:hypothetical protein